MRVHIKHQVNWASNLTSYALSGFQIRQQNAGKKGKKMTSVTEAQRKKDNVELNRGCRLHAFKCAGSMWRPGLDLRGDTNRQSGVTSVRDKSWTAEGPMQVRKGPMCWRSQGRFPRNVHR